MADNSLASHSSSLTLRNTYSSLPLPRLLPALSGYTGLPGVRDTPRQVSVALLPWELDLLTNVLEYPAPRWISLHLVLSSNVS